MILDSWYLINFERWPGRIGINWKKFGWNVNNKIYVSRGTLKEQCFWKKMLKISGLSDELWFLLDGGENFLRACQNCNKCPEKQTKENFFL